MTFYYNEFDPKAAAWLRELIKAGQIPPGEVDERSICDVQPSDLAGFVSCHFFAGIGGWPYALRLAGWPDDKPVWTGSCPCPPFSSAGKKQSCPECGCAKPFPCPWRTGYFTCSGCDHSWFADARHLWPEFWRLIAECQPAIVFGEQVASADGRVWLVGVRGTLETVGYAVGAADLCSAGVGAPNIRQRLWWMAHADLLRCDQQRGGSGPSLREAREIFGTDDNCTASRLGHAEELGWHFERNHNDAAKRAEFASGIGSSSRGLEGHAGDGDNRNQPGWFDTAAAGPTHATGSVSRFWDDYDLIRCLDGKARRVESGTFPLASGVPGRVGILRGYGNAINPELAKIFIQACEEARGEIT
jgi:DNA (cytosine-5)-methyltransferase 1